ncbi:hypothetical protein K435DRAFT_866930 [Dendrothele bispora CBS 962.96]|uniref:Uncharacterized protein n=1 Tax=Dendrothele bispora (strain CBS 962.96) TaxID=1314807 RepID=A0A4S8LFP6_DENBC|nr:hypothetical protein K435DRAFT_866930 [Dendrothele bispora CBS 962.96]
MVAKAFLSVSCPLSIIISLSPLSFMFYALHVDQSGFLFAKRWSSLSLLSLAIPDRCKLRPVLRLLTLFQPTSSSILLAS